MTINANRFGLDELGRRFGLDALSVERLGRLAGFLAEDPEAPTTIRTPEAIRDDHLADSLVALELAPLRSAAAVADLGSGAGLPALPLAIALPDTAFTLIESNRRKAEFLRRAIIQCGLANASVCAERAETAGASSGTRGAFDVVTARALAPLGAVAEYAAPLLRVGGTLVAWRGRREPEVEVEADAAAEILGLCVHDPVPVAPYSETEHRFLHLMSKVSATPDRFPRRPGMARKRPLGARRAGV